MIHKTNLLIIKKDDKILLVKDSRERYGYKWTMPGGHVDEGETPYQSAVREAKEEIGGAIIEMKPITKFVHTVPAGEKKGTRPEHEHECYVFVGKPIGEIVLSSEATEYDWFTIEEAMSMVLTNYTRKALKICKK